MKASLASATSLVALLAFEVGIDAAIDMPRAYAQQWITPNATLSFGSLGYVLLNTSGGTTVSATETITQTGAGTPGTGKETITFGSVATSPFSGGQTVVTVSATHTAKHVYTFVATTIQTSFSTATFTITGNPSQLSTVTLKAQAVAPEQSTTVSAFGSVRIGTTATIAAITVSNIGNGDLYNSTLAAAQLQGSVGAPSSSVFSGSAHTFTLNDSHYSGSGTATTSAAYTYTYAPTAHTTADSATVVAAFTNGSSAATNAAQTVSLTLSGSGVGPVFESNINGTTYTNSTAIGNTTIAAGTISTGAYKTGATSTVTITISNITSDSASSATLTDLTLESFNLSGANASDFTVVGFTTNTVVAEASSVTVTLDFSGPTVGNYTADLNIDTDEGAAYQGSGAVFSYALSAKVPEPATIVTLGVGLAGLAFARRRRRLRCA